MTRKWFRQLSIAGAVLALGVSGMAAPAAAQPASLAPLLTPGPQAAPTDRYLVVLKPAQSLDRRSAVERNVSAGGGRITHRYSRVLNGFAATLPGKALAAVRANAAVAYVERDSVITGGTVQPNPPSWGIDRIDQHNLPLDNSYTYDTTGAGVTAFIVDSGIRTTHTEFGGRASFGANFVADGNTHDCHGHGTHVAGTVGGATYGVAKAVDLVAVRVLDCTNSGWTADLVSAMDWIAANHPPRSVANFSLQGYGTASNDAAERLIDSGVQTVFIANNFNTDACTNAPRSPRGVVVGAVDSLDQKASFSSYGTCVDVFAPGVGITSSTNVDDNASGSWSGTSMAAPHVTGWIARYLEANPTATLADSKAAIISSSTKDVLTNIGAGSPNRLLYADPGTPGGDTTPPSTPGTPVASNLTPTSVTLDWAASTDDTGVVAYDVYAPQLVATYPTNTGELTWLTPNTTYTFSVRARDAAGNTSPASGTVTVTTPAEPAGTCEVTYRVTDQWQTGFNASVTYTNTGTTTVNGWVIAWTYADGQVITSGWDAAFAQNGAEVTATNLSWNQTVAPGASVTAGFGGTHTGTNTVPTAFTVNGATCTIG